MTGQIERPCAQFESFISSIDLMASDRTVWSNLPDGTSMPLENLTEPSIAILKGKQIDFKNPVVL
jgi:hypothetical protein